MHKTQKNTSTSKKWKKDQGKGCHYYNNALEKNNKASYEFETLAAGLSGVVFRNKTGFHNKCPDMVFILLFLLCLNKYSHTLL